MSQPAALYPIHLWEHTKIPFNFNGTISTALRLYNNKILYSNNTRWFTNFHTLLTYNDEFLIAHAKIFYTRIQSGGWYLIRILTTSLDLRYGRTIIKVRDRSENAKPSIKDLWAFVIISHIKRFNCRWGRMYDHNYEYNCFKLKSLFNDGFSFKWLMMGSQHLSSSFEVLLFLIKFLFSKFNQKICVIHK